MNPLDLKDDIVVFDIDGVLVKYDFGKLGFKIMPEKEWIRANMQMDMYSFMEKTSIFDELISTLNPMNMYVLSVASSSFEQNNKINFILENQPNIREDNIIFVSQNEYKVEILKELREIYDKARKGHKRIVMIEDNTLIMASIEELKDERIRCLLVSDFI